MEPSEIEFLAEGQLITIEPNFRQGKLFLFEGDFGPFHPGQNLDVPLWVGISLKQQRKCR